MTVQTFKEMLATRPFKPVKITMSSGDSYELRHPEMAVLTRTSLMIAINMQDGIPDDFRTLSLLHIASMKPLSMAST
jgi:hypothetical protein